MGTSSIGHRAAENVLHAIRFARDTGRPINTHITISLIALGIHDEEAGAFFRKLQISVSRWWRYQRVSKGRDIGPPIAVYSHANPAGSRHVDLCMHLPADIREEFIAALDKRLCKLTGLDDLGDALHVQPAPTPGSLAKYILRGINPVYASYLHIRAANEGHVSCRRTGTSRAIGRAARGMAAWDRKRSVQSAA